MVGLSLRPCAFFWRNRWTHWTVHRHSCLQRRRASRRHRTNVCRSWFAFPSARLCVALHTSCSYLASLETLGKSFCDLLWKQLGSSRHFWWLSTDEPQTSSITAARPWILWRNYFVCVWFFWCQSHLTENESQQCIQGQTFARGLNKTHRSVITINWSTSLLTQNPTCDGAQH